MKNSIKHEILKFLEANPEASKSRIEDYMKDLKGTTGDCVSRRLRELVSSGTVSKVKKEWNDDYYTAYRVVELLPQWKPTKKGMDNPSTSLTELKLNL